MFTNLRSAIRVLTGVRPAAVRFDEGEADLCSQITADNLVELLYPPRYDWETGLFVRDVDDLVVDYVRALTQQFVFDAIRSYAGQPPQLPVPSPLHQGGDGEIPF